MNTISAINKSQVNHITFLLDRSGSMQGRENEVISVFDNQIKYLAQRSKELNNETRVSVYIFDNVIECLFFDKDVLRLPSLKGLYQPRNETNLIGATLKSLEDSRLIPEIYNDHSHLVYVLTDGRHNYPRNSVAADTNKLENYLCNLPSNYTVAVFVPDQTAVFEAKKFGFLADNISVWDINAKNAVEGVGETMQKATEHYFQQRAKGVKSVKGLFKVDVSKVSSDKVRDSLKSLAASEYIMLDVDKDSGIRDFVEKHRGNYVIGYSYYELMKAEYIQPNKQILIQNIISHKVYGGSEARQLLNLPDYEVKVTPSDFGNYKIFVQSTSTNRKLIKNTKLVVLK